MVQPASFFSQRIASVAYYDYSESYLGQSFANFISEDFMSYHETVTKESLSYPVLLCSFLIEVFQPHFGLC